MDGMIRWAKLPEPEGGNQPSQTPKIMIIRMPLQKVGMLWAPRTRPMSNLVKRCLRQTAMASPTGRPTTKATNSAPAASCRV